MTRRLKLRTQRIALLLLMTISLTHTVLLHSSAYPFRHTSSNQVKSTSNLYTRWGYQENENRYNDLILTAVETRWDTNKMALPPLMFKALIATESAFKPLALSKTGAAGLTQLTSETARKVGLQLYPTDQRMLPEVSIPAGVQVLKQKAILILEPELYHFHATGKHKPSPFGDRVSQYYQKYGYPTLENYWRLSLAAYNGGGKTVLGAMQYAIESDLDPREWQNLTLSSNPKKSPLYKSCRDIYPHRAWDKYQEMVHYPEKILALVPAKIWKDSDFRRKRPIEKRNSRLWKGHQ